MELREIVKLIMEKKFPGLPEAQQATRLALMLGVEPMDVRRLAGLAPGSGRNQDKQFQLAVKIMKLCAELGININPGGVGAGELATFQGRGLLDASERMVKAKAEEAVAGSERAGTTAMDKGSYSRRNGSSQRKRRAR